MQKFSAPLCSRCRGQPPQAGLATRAFPCPIQWGVSAVTSPLRSEDGLKMTSLYFLLKKLSVVFKLAYWATGFLSAISSFILVDRHLLSRPRPPFHSHSFPAHALCPSAPLPSHPVLCHPIDTLSESLVFRFFSSLVGSVTFSYPPPWYIDYTRGPSAHERNHSGFVLLSLGDLALI